MALRINRSRSFVAVGMLAVMLAMSTDATAAGVIVKGTGGPVPGSDPFAFYDFEVSISAGYQLNGGDYFKFTMSDGNNGLLGITPPNPPGPGNITTLPTPGSGSFVVGPYQNSFPSATITLAATSPFASDVEWQYVGVSPIVGGPNGTLIGDFDVFTSVSIPVLPMTVTYVAQSHNTATGDPYVQGPGGDAPPVTISLQSVPEPSSAILLALGSCAAFPLLWIRERRRQRLPVCVSE